MACRSQAVGTVFANLGVNVGLDPEFLRRVAAAGDDRVRDCHVVHASFRRFAVLGSRVGNIGQGALSSLSGDSLASQFGIGLVLGLVWSPCVGPTLGAATTLAAQGRHLGQIALLMMVFGLGAGAPLVLRSVVPLACRCFGPAGCSHHWVVYRRPRWVWSLSCWESLFFWGMTAM